jgi:hypothetical protein
MREHPRRFTCQVIATVAIAAVTATAAAQEAADRPLDELRTSDFTPVRSPYDAIRLSPAVLELVAGLDAETYAAREAATRALRDARFSKEQLCAVLAQVPLSAEQRYRLLDVVEDAIIEAPRGALGIRMQWSRPPMNQPGESRVVDLLPDLPAREVLRIDDLIYRVDGLLLLSQDDLITYVQSLTPGAKVTLGIRRPREDDEGRRVLDQLGDAVYEDLEVEITLGSADLLRDDPATGPTFVERQRRDEAARIMAQFGPRPKTLARN